MLIEPVCPKLFEVKDILPESVVEEIKNLDWLSLPTDAPPLQEMMIRRRIKDEENLFLTETNRLLEKHGKQLSAMLNLKFKYIRTLWWLDLPGFTSGVHIDSTNCPALQAYWLAPNTTYGTRFYSGPNPRRDKLIKGFDFIPNTGYLNDLTGSDSEKIYHGMLNPVPENTFRISSYTQFWLD